VVFELPRLQDRRDDIPFLAKAFLKEANFAYNKDVKDISERAMVILQQYDWPGNIRELKWCIHRAVATVRKEILEVADLTLSSSTKRKEPEPNDAESPDSLDGAVAEIEKRYIKKALAAAGGNKTAAAHILGISVRQMHYKLKQYSL